MTSNNTLPIRELDVFNKSEFIYDYLHRHDLAVLSTISKDLQPESAVVEYSESKSLELVFDTYSHFEKYANLKNNPNVALVISGNDETTLQYRGLATELGMPDLDFYRQEHLRKFPGAAKFENYDGLKYFKITPTWIRFMDVTSIPWKQLELRLA